MPDTTDPDEVDVPDLPPHRGLRATSADAQTSTMRAAASRWASRLAASLIGASRSGQSISSQSAVSRSCTSKGREGMQRAAPASARAAALAAWWSSAAKGYGHEQRGQPRHGELGDRQRAGPTEGQIRPRIPARHVALEVDHAGIDAGLRVRGGHAIPVGAARLVEDPDRLAGEGFGEFHHGFVDLSRALTAPEDEQMERCARVLAGRRFVEGGDERSAKRDTAVHDVVRSPTQATARGFEAEEDMAREPRRQPVDATGDGVRFDQGEPGSCQHGGERGGDRRESAHRHHDVCIVFPQDTSCPPDLQQRSGESRHPSDQTASHHLPAGQRDQLEPGLGHELRLEALLGSDEQHAIAAQGDLLAEGERGRHVSTGSTARDDPAQRHGDAPAPPAERCDSRATASRRPRATHDTIKRGPAIGEEGKREALGRQEAHHHRGVDDRRQRQQRRHAERDQQVEALHRCAGDAGTRDQERRESAEHQQHADEPEFLGDEGKDEVGVGFGEILELLLAVADAHAEQAAPSESHHRLDELVPLAQPVRPGIDEARDAAERVGVARDVEHDARADEGGGHDEAREPRPADDQEQGDERDRDDRAAEVRLDDQQRHGRQGEGRSHHRALVRQFLVAVAPGDHRRDRQQRGELRDLRRLEPHPDAGDREPARGAVHFHPECPGEAQQQYAESPERQGEPAPDAERDAIRDDRRDHAGDQGDDVIQEQRRDPLLEIEGRRRAVAHQHTDREQQQRRQHDAAVEGAGIGGPQAPLADGVSRCRLSAHVDVAPSSRITASRNRSPRSS